MDKFALLQIKKKQALELERKQAGLEAGDVLARVVMTDAEKDAINQSFGYPKPALGCWSIGKEHTAAVWWTYDGPGPWVEPPPHLEVAAEVMAPPPASPPLGTFARSLSRRFSVSFSSGKSSPPGASSDGKGVEEEEEEQVEQEEDMDWGALSRKKIKPTKEQKRQAKAEAERARREAEKKAEDDRLQAEDRELLGTTKTLGLVGWEIARYRRELPALSAASGEGSQGGWKYKGSVTIEVQENNKMQTVLHDLGENCEYRFTVRAINGRGRGAESAPSNSVMIEDPLPNGWLRFFDERLQRQYYANVKTGMSSWDRPDFDPYFLDEHVLLLFSRVELAHLRDIYDEEYAHFHAVLRERFADVLREVGERMSNARVYKVFKGYSKDAYQISSWQIFMDVMMHIKKRKIATSMQGIAEAGNNARLMVRQQIVSSLLSKSDKDKFKNWTLEWSNIAEKEFYRHNVTKKKQWDMPDEIRFYLPPRLETKMLTSFDFGHIEIFKQYYSLLDMSGSGDLSPNELKLILDALMIDLEESKFNALILTVDLNGNGTIEFDEFCWMMYELARTDGKGGLRDVVGGGAGTGGAGGLNIDLALVSANLQRIKSNAMGGGGTGLQAQVTPRGDMVPPPPQVGQKGVAATTLTVSFALDDGAHTVSTKAASLPLRDKPAPTSPASNSSSPLLGTADRGSKRVAVAPDEFSLANTSLSGGDSVGGGGGGRELGYDGEIEGEEGEGERDGGEQKDQEAEARQEEEPEEEREEEWLDEDEDEDEDEDSSKARPGALSGPEPGTDGASAAFKRLSKQVSKQVWGFFHPSARKAELEATSAATLAKAKSAEKKREMHAKRAQRDGESAHGPFCFCGCRAD